MSLIAKVNEDLSKIYKEMTGKGPKKLKTYIVDNLLIVKFDWYNEYIFDVIDNNGGDDSSLKNVIEDLFIIAKPKYIEVVESNIGIKVKKLYFDIQNIENKVEKVAVFLMEEKITNK